METKDIDVSDDNIFLQLLLEKHNISPKQLAGWTGRACSMIYKYLAGEFTIPSVIWRSLFDHTLDVTVFNIIRGDIPCILATITNQGFEPDAATLKQLLNMRQKQLNLESYILKILSDGEINGKDSEAIANFKLAFPDMIQAQAKIHQAIITAYRKSEAQA